MAPIVISRRLEVPEWPGTKSAAARLSPIPATPEIPAMTAMTTKSFTFVRKVEPKRRPLNTALHQAVLDERIRQVRLLVSKHGANINSVDVFGRTPLMLTCMLNNENIAHKMVRIFVDQGATFNSRDVMGRTILSYACMKGKYNLVKRILREDFSEVNEPDNDSCTPLHHSAVQGNAKIMRLLVHKVMQYSLDIDKKDKLGYTAFLLACKHGWYRSALCLLEDGFASPCTRDNEYYYNATKWINISRPPCIDPRAQFISRRSKTTTAFSNTALSFDRSSGKSSIYLRHRIPVICKHTRNEPDPFSSTDIDLPDVDPYRPHATLAEELSLKQELLYRIEELFPSEKRRPGTSNTRAKPSTAKLLALRPDGGNFHAGSEGISQLLNIYANHYAQVKAPTRRPVTVSLGEKVFRRPETGE